LAKQQFTKAEKTLLDKNSWDDYLEQEKEYIYEIAELYKENYFDN
jgi:3-phenylpropionate/cinnamic acid dioxygenase small subunit